MKWYQGAVVLVAAAHFLNTIPTLLSFDRFAFGDCGWPLTVDGLLERGQKPVDDFAYFYGLLTLAFNRLAFAVFGRSPETVIGIYAVCSLLIAWGVGRVAAVFQFRCLPAVFLVVSASSIVIPRGFPSPAHAFEAAFLMLALAEHARGRLDRALALTVLAVLVKASLGYVYGLILVLHVLAGWPGGASRWKRLIPAAALAAGILLPLAIVFGITPVIRTLLPLDGMTVYSDEGVGFLFGAGKEFWWPKKPTLVHYLGIPGFWLVSSLALFVIALGLLPRIRDIRANFVVTCAVLHAIFVFVLFGNQYSWIYYPYMLFVGTAAALNLLPRWTGRVLSVLLTAAAIAGQSRWLWTGDVREWWKSEPSAATAGLFAPPHEAQEWEAIRAKGNVYVLTRMGCPQFLAPEVRGPEWWCLIEPIMKPGERDAVLQGIRNADWLVSPIWHDNDLLRWQPLADEWKLRFETDPDPHFRSIRVYHRKPGNR